MTRLSRHEVEELLNEGPEEWAEPCNELAPCDYCGDGMAEVETGDDIICRACAKRFGVEDER